MGRFELFLAWRHLIASKGQTLLTVATVVIAVTVIIFISTLIGGVQKSIIEDGIGSLAHVTLEPPDPLPTRYDRTDAASRTADRLWVSEQQKRVRQRPDISRWQPIVAELARLPGVRTVCPVVRENAFLTYGGKRIAVGVTGSDPARIDRINQIQKNLITGRWLDISGEEVVIGWRLADDLGVTRGDRVRFQAADGQFSTFTIAGIFDTGADPLDRGQAFMTLRAAQSLFGAGRNIRAIFINLEDPFQADVVAARIRALFHLKTESWLVGAQDLLGGLQGTASSRDLISGFALMASAFSVASVLIVSVTQKTRQIGILKSMGATDRQIQTVFLLEGMVVSLIGAVLGSGAGYLLLSSLLKIRLPARFGRELPLFEYVIEPPIFLTACALAIGGTLVAALLPARRAARLNPVDALRS